MLFESTYNVTTRERKPFGTNWCGPAKLGHFAPVLVAKYPAQTDGQPTEVWCEAAPARFYTIKVLANNRRNAYEFGTGSGMEELAAKMAAAIAEGMLALHTK